MKTLMLTVPLATCNNHVPILNETQVSIRVLECVLGVLTFEGVLAEIVDREVSPETPRGYKSLMAAGVPEHMLDTWFENQCDMIRDDVKGAASEDMDNLTLEEFVDDMMNGNADEDWEELEDDPQNIELKDVRATMDFYARYWAIEVAAKETGTWQEMQRRLELLEQWKAKYPLDEHAVHPDNQDGSAEHEDDEGDDDGE